jgi:hypothetical protein
MCDALEACASDQLKIVLAPQELPNNEPLTKKFENLFFGKVKLTHLMVQSDKIRQGLKNKCQEQRPYSRQKS